VRTPAIRTEATCVFPSHKTPAATFYIQSHEEAERRQRCTTFSRSRSKPRCCGRSGNEQPRRTRERRLRAHPAESRAGSREHSSHRQTCRRWPPQAPLLVYCWNCPVSRDRSRADRELPPASLNLGYVNTQRVAPPETAARRSRTRGYSGAGSACARLILDPRNARTAATLREMSLCSMVTMARHASTAVRAVVTAGETPR
jgi:hypothetical protein